MKTTIDLPDAILILEIGEKKTKPLATITVCQKRLKNYEESKKHQ